MTAEQAGIQQPEASIVLSVMGLRELAVYGFRSWLLQDYDRPYEVVLNLYNDARPMFDKLLPPANPNCRVRINVFDPPQFFNISATNNLGLHLARGKYVFWANADIIYPSFFLKRAMTELLGRDIYFAVASRVNMTRAQTNSFKPVEQYSKAGDFDDVTKGERDSGVTIWRAISPWIVRRDVGLALGGFDSRVLVAEDRDIMTRAMHYLRRRGLQQALFSLSDLSGYHMDHDSTGLSVAMTESIRIMAEREKLLDANSAGEDDIVATPLDDRDALLRVIQSTKRPPALGNATSGVGKKITRRAARVWQALRYGA